MACCATSLAGADWPGFRGATGSGVSPDSGLPVKWSATDNLRWVTKLPGRANSSPAVIGDRVYLTTATDDDTLQVLALAASSGEKVWTRSVGSGKLRTFGAEELYAHRHNSATPTPAADEGHVWAFFGTGLLVCLDRDGNVRWEKNLTTEYGEYDVRFGMASSPRLWGENLYLTCLQKGPSYVVALDKRSGKEVWKKERSFPAEDDGPDAYSSPVLLKENGKVALIVAGSDHVNAYDTRSGAQLWFSGGLKVDSAYGRIICSPAVGDGVVVQCSANPPNAPGHAVAWRTGGAPRRTRPTRQLRSATRTASTWCVTTASHRFTTCARACRGGVGALDPRRSVRRWSPATRRSTT
jgi:outer membrane protein assembly factor BamB